MFKENSEWTNNKYPTKLKYTKAYLEKLPTIRITHHDDVKVENTHYTVLLSRMKVADGAPYDNQVTVMMKDRIDGKWKIIEQYQAL